jgi:DNA repair ATPase RecN
MLTEEQAEIMALTDLATGLSDGMKSLTAANISRPVKTFDNPIPEQLSEVEGYADRFIDWQVDRQKKPEAKATWTHPDAYHDVALYLRRRVWQAKVEAGSIINPIARMLATTTTLHRKYRADVHEALNHAAKHNEEVAKLGQDMKDQLDEVVKTRLEETTRMIAGAALATVPQLQQMLMQGRLEHVE